MGVGEGERVAGRVGDEGGAMGGGGAVFRVGVGI